MRMSNKADPVQAGTTVQGSLVFQIKRVAIPAL